LKEEEKDNDHREESTKEISLISAYIVFLELLRIWLWSSVNQFFLGNYEGFPPDKNVGKLA
jgi:hypothetical protein